MKNLCVLLLVTACSMSAVAQTDPTQPALEQTTIFTGVVYDHNLVTDGSQISGRYGVIQNLTGHLYILPNVEFGKYNSVSTELALLYRIPESKFTIGLLAGPGVDWADPSGDEIAYLTGAAGGIVGYHVNTRWGVWAAGQYQFSGVQNDLYVDGFIAGAGFFVNW